MESSSPKTKLTIEALWRLQKIILDSLDFNRVVQQIVDGLLLELGYLQLGYKIIVLSLLDEEAQILKRISISQTTEAQKALEVTPVPFHQIDISTTESENFSIKTLTNKQPYITYDWADILCPSYTPEEAREVQKIVGIKMSMTYPVIVKEKAIGVLIFSMIKEEKDVTDDERDLIRGFTDIVGLAIQNSQLYSSLQETTANLKKANIQLQALDKLKDEFVSLASHELRTPMTIIKSYVWMLLQQTKTGNFTDKQKLYLERTYTTTDRLIKLVNDMLNVSRIESGRISIELKAIDIIQLVKDVEVEMLPKAQELGAKLIVESYEQLPLAMADSERIKQVLINLIGNALKFTPSGGTVKVILTRTGENITLKVQDTGKGISKEDLGRLFQKFGTLQTNSLTKTNPQGTGLGLYISKSLIEMHGGKISAESEGEGKGTTFLFTLKVAPPNATQPSPTPTTSINGAPTIIT